MMGASRYKSRIPVKRLLTRFRVGTGRGAKWMCSDADVAALEALIERADEIVAVVTERNEKNRFGPERGIPPALLALYRHHRIKFAE